MRANGKKVNDVAFNASRAIDWDGMAAVLVSTVARKEFANLRRAFDEVHNELGTKFSQEPQPVVWEYYQKGIGSRLVDMTVCFFFSCIEIPKFVDTVTPQYKPRFDQLRTFSAMSANEYFAKHPELRKKFNDEICNDHWGY